MSAATPAEPLAPTPPTAAPPEASRPTPSAARPRAASLMGWLLLLVATSAVVFGQSVWFDWVVFDDPMYVTQHELVKGGLSVDGVREAFTTYACANWHPLTWLSLMADVSLAGVRPGMMHFTNVVIHTLNVVLMYLSLRALTGSSSRSLFVTLVFALHPTRAESVAWISERKDVLCVLFGLLATLCYVRYARRPQLSWYLLMLLLYACSLMSKQMLVTLPCVFWLFDYWPLARWPFAPRLASPTAPDSPAPSPRQFPTRSVALLVVEKVPMFALAAAAAYLCTKAQVIAIQSTDRFPLMGRFVNALVAYTLYVQKLVWPTGLEFFYPYPQQGWPPTVVAGAIALFVTLTAASLLLIRSRPAVFVGWSLFLGTLVPVIGLVQVGSQSMADRYTYYPYIGLAMMVAFGLPQRLLPRSTKFLWAASLILAVIYTGLLYRQVGTWRDSLTLGNHALAVDPTNPRAHEVRGIHYLHQNQTDLALVELQQVVKLSARLPKWRNNLAAFLIRLDRAEEAVPHLVEALEIDPEYDRAHINLGRAYLKLGRYDDAVKHFEHLVKKHPEKSEIWREYATRLESSGHLDEAIAVLERSRLGMLRDMLLAHLEVKLRFRRVDRGGSFTEADRQAIRRAVDLADPGTVTELESWRRELIRRGETSLAGLLSSRAEVLRKQQIPPKRAESTLDPDQTF